MTKMYTWSKTRGYECSSKGDRIYSAMAAIMPDGRPLEMWYQCDVKGFDPNGFNWKLGKDKAPINKLNKEELYRSYVDLWRIHMSMFPFKLTRLRKLAAEHGNVLRDSLATNEINQARALSDLLNENMDLQYQHRYHLGNVTSPLIGIFVFGSNLKGIHGTGAAKMAVDRFGASFGQSTGRQGNAYAIPTKATPHLSLPLVDVQQHIKDFCQYTQTHVNDTFIVTRIGCGLAGFKDAEIAPLFKAANRDNCIFDWKWMSFLEED